MNTLQQRKWISCHASLSSWLDIQEPRRKPLSYPDREHEAALGPQLGGWGSQTFPETWCGSEARDKWLFQGTELLVSLDVESLFGRGFSSLPSHSHDEVPRQWLTNFISPFHSSFLFLT